MTGADLGYANVRFHIAQRKKLRTTIPLTPRIAIWHVVHLGEITTRNMRLTPGTYPLLAPRRRCFFSY